MAVPVHRSRLKRRRRETPPDVGNHGRERNSPYNWLGGAATAVKSCNLITGDRNKCAPDKWAVGVMNYRPTWRPSVSRPNESHRSNRALGRPIRHSRDVTERWRMQRGASQWGGHGASAVQGITLDSVVSEVYAICSRYTNENCS